LPRVESSLGFNLSEDHKHELFDEGNVPVLDLIQKLNQVIESQITFAGRK
jgi:hypothetical protein